MTAPEESAQAEGGQDRAGVLTAAGVRDRLAGGFRTEFFIKTGLVLLGASINLSVIVAAAGPAIAQAVLLITIVFACTWWLAGKLGLDDKLRALLASAVTAASALAGEDVLQITSIVKVTQNALIGVVAVALTVYFTVKVERVAGSPRPEAGKLWRRFPKIRARLRRRLSDRYLVPHDGKRGGGQGDHRSRKRPAPISITASPAVACGTHTCRSPSLAPAS